MTAVTTSRRGSTSAVYKGAPWNLQSFADRGLERTPRRKLHVLQEELSIVLALDDLSHVVPWQCFYYLGPQYSVWPKEQQVDRNIPCGL